MRQSNSPPPQGLLSEFGFNSRGSFELSDDSDGSGSELLELVEFAVDLFDNKADDELVINEKEVDEIENDPLDLRFIKEREGDDVQDQEVVFNDPVKDNLQQQFIQRSNSSRRRGTVDPKKQVENQIANLKQKFDEAIKEHNQQGNVSDLRTKRFEKLPKDLPEDPLELAEVEKEVFVIHEILNKYMKTAVTKKAQERSQYLVQERIEGPLGNIGKSIFKKGEKEQYLEKTAVELLDKEKCLPQEKFTGIICIGKIEDKKLRRSLFGKICKLSGRDLDDCFQASPQSQEGELDKLLTKTCIEVAIDNPKWFLETNKSTLETEVGSFNPKSGLFRDNTFGAKLIGGYGMAMTRKAMKKQKETFLQAAKKYQNPGDLAVALVKIMRDIKVPNEILVLCETAFEKALLRFNGKDNPRKMASKTVTGIVLLRVFLPQVTDFFQKAKLKEGMKVCQGLQKLANGQPYALLDEAANVIEQAIDVLVNDLLEQAAELRKNN